MFDKVVAAGLPSFSFFAAIRHSYPAVFLDSVAGRLQDFPAADHAARDRRIRMVDHRQAADSMQHHPVRGLGERIDGVNRAWLPRSCVRNRGFRMRLDASGRRRRTARQRHQFTRTHFTVGQGTMTAIRPACPRVLKTPAWRCNAFFPGFCGGLVVSLRSLSRSNVSPLRESCKRKNLDAFEPEGLLETKFPRPALQLVTSAAC